MGVHLRKRALCNIVAVAAKIYFFVRVFAEKLILKLVNREKSVLAKTGKLSVFAKEERIIELTAARVHHGANYSVRIKKIVRERVKARYGSAGLILVECKSLYSRSANANAGKRAGSCGAGEKIDVVNGQF